MPAKPTIYWIAVCLSLSGLQTVALAKRPPVRADKQMIAVNITAPCLRSAELPCLSPIMVEVDPTQPRLASAGIFVSDDALSTKTEDDWRFVLEHGDEFPAQ